LEERYMNMRRRRSDYRNDPPPHRMEPRHPPRHRPQKRRRSTAASVASGFYKALVILSALIVAVYIAFTLTIRAPEQKQKIPPSQNGPAQTLGPNFNTSSSRTASSIPSEPADRVLSRREGVYTIFLAATDVEGYRTDTMMVMCYDTVKQTIGVVSIPRDTLVARESGNPHLVYGKGGVEQRVEDVSHMLGIPIDFYVKVNIKGFITLVDYLGGVDFYVPCDMDYDDPTPGQALHIHYKEGRQVLGGQQAMEVARFRKNNDGSGYTDTGRTQTQQKLLIALAKKVLAWNNIAKINGFVEIFNKNVSTDLSMDEMLYFASQAMGLDPSTAV